MLSALPERSLYCAVSVPEKTPLSCRKRSLCVADAFPKECQKENATAWQPTEPCLEEPPKSRNPSHSHNTPNFWQKTVTN